MMHPQKSILLALHTAFHSENFLFSHIFRLVFSNRIQRKRAHLSTRAVEIFQIKKFIPIPSKITSLMNN